ncbi:MAG: glycoside hydrolase family 20 zincin-like fold domain-containing protein [Planctomycetota bacterium]|jgi:hypothetical protein
MIKNPVIIPSPANCSLTSEFIKFNKLKVVDEQYAPPYAVEMLNRLVDLQAEKSIVFKHFESENEQAYRISIDSDGVTIEGAGKAAFIYAAASLLQIVQTDDNSIQLPEGHIFDYPEFKIRGVNWNLLAETRGWSQDASDGREAFIRRFTAGLDLLAEFKLNMVMVDGVGWNSERFSGYSELMQHLNSEAGRRGIKLCFIGYNAGYGAQWHDFDGKVFKNRKTYPDGEIYSCTGSPGHMEKSSIMGTCLSNSELIKLKCEEIKEFVRNVEPGALYIHGLDVAYQDACRTSWEARCDDCRIKWPNDDVNAGDGMAGAYALFFDTIYEAIAEVKNNKTGYNAEKDCMINFVSPNYTVLEEKDEDWQFHLEYFAVLSECIKNKNMYLMLREQLFNYDKSEPRFAQLRRKVGDNCRLSCVYFSSGSGFYNSLPVTADTACIKLFKGIDAVIAGSGNAFQEPRQVMNAEYMWNPESSFNVEIPERESLTEFLPLYKNLCHNVIRPNNIFGDDGLIEIICRKLYGKKAGPLAAEAQKLQAASDSKGSLIAPLWNALLPGWVFSCFKFENPKVQWQEGIDEEIIARAKELEMLMRELIPLNKKAAELYSKAAETRRRGEHLQRMSATCTEGAKLAAITLQWLIVFNVAVEGSPDIQIIDSLITDITKEITRYKSKMSSTLDPNGSDLGQAVRTLEFIIEDLEAIKYTTQHSRYLERKEPDWW